MEFAIGSLQNSILWRHLATCFYIVVYLIVETTFQLGTHTCQLLRVERDVLIACGIGADAHKILHPCSAAEFATTRTGTTDAACFLTGTNLLHLDAHVEGISKHLDELTEVYSLIGDIVENSLVAITLILYVSDFHLQSQVQGNLSALNHGSMLAALCFLAFVEVYLLGNAIDALDVVLRLEICLLQLQFHESTGECNHTDVVTRVGFHSHYVALFEVEVIHIMVISLSGILELHFYEVGALGITWHVCEPVVCVQLSVLSSHRLAAESSVAAVPQSEFHILVIHDKIYFIILLMYIDRLTPFVSLHFSALLDSFLTS